MVIVNQLFWRGY